MMNDDVIITYYVALYIDLLGQSEKLKRIKDLPNNSPEREVFIDALKDTAGRVNGIRDAICNAIEGLFENSLQNNKLFHFLPQKEKNIIVTLDKQKFKTQFFSDCSLIYCQIHENEENIYLMNMVYKLIACANIVSFVGLATNTPIRGGIDIGLGGNLLNDDGLYGPVLSQIYWLENEKAKWPRIAVGDELIKFLHFTKNNNSAEKINIINRELAQRILVQDIYTDHIIGTSLNFITTPMEDETYNLLYPKAIAFVESQIEYFAQNNEMRQRYELLHDFITRQDKIRSYIK